MPDDDKGNEENEKITVSVDGKDVEKTIEELKEIATVSLSEKDETFTLKIDGEEKSLTLDELRAKASESAGAQKKFQDANDLLKKAEGGIRIQELAKELSDTESPDEVKTAEFMRLLGVDPGEINKVLSSAQKGKGGDKAPVTPKTIGVDQLDPQLRSAVEAAERMDLQQIRTNIEKECTTGVDNDKILGKMIDEVQEGAEKGSLKQVLYDMVIEDVRGRILAREPYGTEMVQSSLQKVRARINNLGIPAKIAGQVPVTGLPAVLATLGPEVHATEPIRRVSSSDQGYEENAVKRVQQMMVDAARKMGQRK